MTRWRSVCIPIARLTFVVAILVSISRMAVARPDDPMQTFVAKYCLDCHGSKDPSGDTDLSSFRITELDNADSKFEPSVWERVLRRLQSRQMPPPDAVRPSEPEYVNLISQCDEKLDAYADKYPWPGMPPAVRRMNRNEYRNAVHDLLAVDVSVNEMLPADESSHGFDNVTVTELSPLLLNRYISAAQEISRVAMGGKQRSPGGITTRLPADRTQDTHIEGLPLGTRGGGIIEHTFARDGQYEVQVRLARDRDEEIEGLKEKHELDFLLDRKRVHRLTIEPPKNGDFTNVDKNLKVRFQITAGPHQIGVTFPQRGGSLLEIRRQPFDAAFNRHRHPRREPAIYEIAIVGPFESYAPGESPSRRRLFEGFEGIETVASATATQRSAIAKQILARVMQRAYRRPIDEADFATPMRFFENACETQGFDSGIELALSAILVSPHFLFRVEETPVDAKAGSIYAINDYELASRLSFFLWSSIPDDRLLELAKSNRLHEADVLKAEVDRMLKDARSKSLVENFADQWLYLRNLDSIRPDLRLFPDFDDNLRQAFRKETELLFQCVQREDRSVLDLLTANFSYLNDRLARHYRIPNVIGSHFRRVELEPASHRGGLLRHGSILTVTSYATRTSPTIRGHWILKNVLGNPPPPPPPNVPALKEKQDVANLTVRERLAEHRSNPACASCHNLMDPIGFSLDHFDAVGRWRSHEDEQPIDASGSMPDGSIVRSADELESAILRQSELFAQTLTEKLLTFALGRGVESNDGPEIRRVVSFSRSQDYRFSSLIQGIVASKPFRMRTAP